MVDLLAEVVVPIAMFVMMFGMGLTLSISDFKQVMVFPKAVLLGLFIQLLLMPAAGFGVASAFSLNTMVAVGLVALASSPGGTLSNVVAHLGKGNTALSISLTGLATMVALFTMPLWINLSLQYFGGPETTVEVPVLKTALNLAMFTVVPVTIGMYARSRAPHLEKHEPYLSRGSALTTFVAFIIASIAEGGNTGTSPTAVIVPCMALIAAAILLGFGIPRVMGVNLKDSATTSVEVCMKNVVLPIFVAMNSLDSLEAAMPSMVYTAGMVPAAATVMIAFNLFKKNTE